MALMTKTQFEEFFDALAARMDQIAAGRRAASVAPSSGSLFTIIDEVGSPEIQLALGQAAYDLDAALRDENSFITTSLAFDFGPIVRALQNQVIADGTYSSLDASLTALGVQVPPIIQKMTPSINALGTLLSPANVFSPAVASRALDAVFVGAPGALVDATAAADVPGDGIDLFEADNDVVYLGWNEKPRGYVDSGVAYEYVSVALSTIASADVSLVPEYWNGTAWSPLPTSDGVTTGALADLGTKGFTKSGVIRFAVPNSWARTAEAAAGTPIIDDDLTQRFYIRLKRTADTVVTPPVASALRRGIGMGLVMVKADSSALFVPGDGIQASSYDAVNKIKLRALTNISNNVTATVKYTNRAGTVNRGNAQGAWSSIDVGDMFPSATDSFLTLQSADEGVAAVTAVTITTTATAGAFCIESVPQRTPEL